MCIRDSCKAGLFICCIGNINKNNCKVSCLETSSFRRYKENYVTRNTLEKFRDFRETGPRSWTEATDTDLKARGKSAVKLFAICQLCSVGGRWIVWSSLFSLNLVHSVLCNTAVSNHRNCLHVALFLETFRMCFGGKRGFSLSTELSCTTTRLLFKGKWFGNFLTLHRAGPGVTARIFKSFRINSTLVSLFRYVANKNAIFIVKHPHQMH